MAPNNIRRTDNSTLISSKPYLLKEFEAQIKPFPSAFQHNPFNMYIVIYSTPIAIPIHLYLHTSVYHQPKVLPMQLPGICQSEVLLSSPQVEIYQSPSHPLCQGFTLQGQPLSLLWVLMPSGLPGPGLAAQQLLTVLRWSGFWYIQLFLHRCIQALRSFCIFILLFLF